MGSSLSKIPTTTTNTTMDFAAELSSYEAICIQYPELESFDTTLQHQANQVISTLSIDAQLAHSLSFDTLRAVIGCLLEINQEAVRIILECKKDIWNNPGLFELVEDYFDSSLRTLDFCTALEQCLYKARHSQLIIHVALKKFEEEEEEEEEESDTKFERTLEELRHFKDSGDPFDEEFFRVFESVYNQQVEMLHKLRKKERELDKKITRMKTWRKISGVIFVSVFALVLICSVVAAAVSAPPVLTALASSGTVAMAPVGKWLNSLWINYLNALKGEHVIINKMQVGTIVTISDLDSIRVLVDKLEVEIGVLVQNAEFAIREEEDAVRFVIEEIKKKVEVFMKSVEDLGKQADRCSRDIRRARTVVLQWIIRHPN